MDRSRAEIERIIRERNAASDYERGKQHAQNVLRTLGLREAERDAHALNVSRAPWDYVMGYYEVLNAAKAPRLVRKAS